MGKYVASVLAKIGRVIFFCPIKKGHFIIDSCVRTNVQILSFTKAYIVDFAIAFFAVPNNLFLFSQKNNLFL